MNGPRASFAEKLNSYLSLAEKVFVGLLCIAILLKYTSIDGKPLIAVCLWALAGIFFLSAFKPPTNREQPEGKKYGFMDLFVLAYAPKLLGIGCAVSTIGILSFLLGNEGFKEMLMLGGGVIGLALVVLGYASVTGAKNLDSIVPFLYRAIPILLIASYIIWGVAG